MRRLAEEVVAEAVERFHPRLVLACSFQKEESVLLDMLYSIAPDARVFALDTHVLFPETYAVWREVEQRYGTKVEIYEGPTLAKQAEIHGEALWERKPDLCCAIRKVEPLGRALGGLDAWITGLRRDQSPTRANICDGICTACGANGAICAYRRAAGNPSSASCGLS